ncbi:MAG TPA: lysophospholipid acyltransferase family protein [Thermoanaerobaculia bacterium]|nr:lysophospholipid acyltransferase family protein [Thermoanaerobaculia bacterium]
MRRVVAAGVVGLARVLAGGQVRRIDFTPDERQRVYFANHTSHLDFVVIWAALPKRLRALTRPVAARDYWERGMKRTLALKVFNAVLVDRVRGDPATPNPLDILLAGLGEKHSLIIFPEGTRGDGTQLGTFKSGLYRLGRARPDVELVPVYIDNLNRVLPKGEFAPVPMLASVSFGAPLHVEDGEEKADFLERARKAILELRQW